MITILIIINISQKSNFYQKKSDFYHFLNYFINLKELTTEVNLASSLSQTTVFVTINACFLPLSKKYCSKFNLLPCVLIE
jgi:hypothetical protein